MPPSPVNEKNEKPIRPTSQLKKWLTGIGATAIIGGSIGFIAWWSLGAHNIWPWGKSEDTTDNTETPGQTEDETPDEPADIVKNVNKEVAVYLTWWMQSDGFETIKANHNVITQVNPFWYTLEADGSLIAFAGAEDATIVSYCQRNGITVIPVISNEQDTALVEAIIDNESVKERLIANIVAKVKAQNYDGIEIDYENLLARDKEAYSDFIDDLADALHAEDKVLAIALHAKTSDPGTWDGPAAQDYRRLGAAADYVKIMTYDYHWSTSEAGDIAPITWMTQVYNYAITRIPEEKLLVGIHLYGYDWVGEKGTDSNYVQIQGLISIYSPTIKTSNEGEKYFTYQKGGVTHTVYYSDGAVVADRAEYALTYDLAGVAFWSLGGEDPTTWSTIETLFDSN